MRASDLRVKLNLQSAMEYLMTYGWAILIIAVVLGVLFQLGVFSSASFTPRAPPGSCRVFRTAGTTNLEGVCSGELPQYVTQFNGNGQSYVPYSVTLKPNLITVSVWADITLNPNPTTTNIFADSGGYGNGWRIVYTNSLVYM